MLRSRLLTRLVLGGTLALVLSACLPLTYLPGTARPWYCDPSDTAVNDGHGDAFLAAYTQPKGPLSASDCRLLEEQLTAAEAFAAQYPTVAAVKAAGWIEAAVWSPGQGIHFVDPARQTGPFDPKRPNWLMYDGTGPTAKLTGMIFLVNSGMMPPAGFPGNNDHWHQHHELCTKNGSTPFIVGEHLTDAECAALGGVNVMYMNLWMAHVWLPRYGAGQASDVFNRVHMSVP